MMTALATVTGVTPLDSGYHVDLSCQQQTSCSGCASSKSCSTGVVSKAMGNKLLRWSLTTDSVVTPGQLIEIGFPEKSLLQSASLIYLLPLFALLLGAAVGDIWLAPMLSGGEGVVIVTAVLFTTAAIWLAKPLTKRLELQTKDQVVIVRILGEPVGL
ncbi:SoxR reducing system RseC family protein [Vibrio sp. WJH972]